MSVNRWNFEVLRKKEMLLAKTLFDRILGSPDDRTVRDFRSLYSHLWAEYKEVQDKINKIVSEPSFTTKDLKI